MVHRLTPVFPPSSPCFPYPSFWRDKGGGGTSPEGESDVSAPSERHHLKGDVFWGPFNVKSSPL